MSRRILMWALPALLGIVFTAGITWATSRLTSQRIGLASEPISAGSALAPRVRIAPSRPRKPAGGNTGRTTTGRPTGKTIGPPPAPAAPAPSPPAVSTPTKAPAWAPTHAVREAAPRPAPSRPAAPARPAPPKPSEPHRDDNGGGGGGEGSGGGSEHHGRDD